jgi:hypothetical protein
MHVMRDILDKQLVDRDEAPFGRVDGIVAELREGAPPRIVQLEMGFVTIASRIAPWAERLAEWMHKRWSVRRSARFHIAWDHVIEANMHHVKVDLCAEDTTAFDWERWLRNHLIGKIPGASSDE